MPGIGLFELPSMPDTSLEGTGKDEYAADGLKIEPIEPMKKWRIKFDGKLRLTTISILSFGRILDMPTRFMVKKENANEVSAKKGS